MQIQLIFCDIRKTSALLEIQNSFFASLSNSPNLVGRMGAKKYTAFQQSFMIFFPLFLRLTGHFVNDSYVKMWSFVLHIICKEKGIMMTVFADMSEISKRVFCEN